MVCYAEKQEKPFWFSSLGQIVQFGAITFCRTFKNYFGQFVWIEKRVTIIVACHFMKRRLKKRKHVMLTGVDHPGMSKYEGTTKNYDNTTLRVLMMFMRCHVETLRMSCQHLGKSFESFETKTVVVKFYNDIWLTVATCSAWQFA